MAHRILRVGLIGAGANTRLRHLPGLQALADVEITAVCNRRPASTVAVAREFNIPHTYDRWYDLIADPDIDVVVIGTWPYLHCPITLAALRAGKHVLTEARMSMNAAEAHEMLAAARRHPRQVCQIVPSPYGLKGDTVMRELLEEGFIGELREVHVYSRSGALADAVPPGRIDPESGVRRPVGTPDSVQVLSVLTNGARASYQVSGVTPFGQGASIQLYGTDGVLYYDLLDDRILGVSRTHGAAPAPAESLREIPIPKEKERGWQVEADFVDSIRLGTPVQLTDFETGVAYMEFTEAVARSARLGMAVKLPLNEKG